MYQLHVFLLTIAFLVIDSKHIELTKNNFVSLRESIDSDVSSKFLYRLNSLNTTPVYIYINSPGGDVMAGLEIINYIKSFQSQNKEISCICHNAMSMAFVIFQYCSYRYILHSSTLMQHQMSLKVDGKIYDINSRLKYYNTIENELNTHQAQRMKIQVPDFINRIKDDWWMYSNEIIKNNAADDIVSVSCSFPNYYENITSHTLFGELTIVYSACPMINYPIDIIFPILFNDTDKLQFINRNVKYNSVITYETIMN
jgi:ATP-dependent protease ClpP protease subunit